MQDELESMSTEDLLSQLAIAHDKDIWDRRCQFMGATISYRAVREAAQSTELQTAQSTASAQAPGISKQELVQWIHDSETYRVWADIMQSKLEPKSYQTNIAKAMQRAGYERSTSVSVGRHVRWYLPSDLCPRDPPADDAKVGIKKEKGEEEEETKEDAKEDTAGEENEEGPSAKEEEGKDAESSGEEMKEDGSKNQEGEAVDE